MRDLLILIAHLITTVIGLAKPGGLRAVVAESVLAKHQLLIVSRSRQRSPNLRIRDRLIAGLCSLWIKPSRFRRVAILFKPSTLLSFILLWFNESIVSSDHDPLYRFHQWEANLRILDVLEIKTVPHVPWSHPFIERLIGTIRRDCLDRLLFWTAIDLEMKLIAFQDYYNGHRTHSALEGQTPIEAPESKRADLKRYRWKAHCRGLYQTPIAA